jgi:hypothetical protein
LIVIFGGWTTHLETRWTSGRNFIAFGRVLKLIL